MIPGKLYRVTDAGPELLLRPRIMTCRTLVDSTPPGWIVICANDIVMWIGSQNTPAGNWETVLWKDYGLCAIDKFWNQKRILKKLVLIGHWNPEESTQTS